MNVLKEIYDLNIAKKEIEARLKKLWEKVENEGILEQGAYAVQVKESIVRMIDANKFRESFGQDIFNRVAKITLTDATKEIPDNKIEEAGCITTTVRTSKQVVCTKQTSTGLHV